MNRVFVAERQDGCVGYFQFVTGVPADWKLNPITLDITEIMESMNCSKEQALEVMNRHWS